MVKQATRVLLADDEVHIRYLIREVARAEGLNVVAEANNGDDALALYRAHRPDLTLLDINLPLRPGDEVLGDILREDPDARVVMLTMVSDEETVRRCLELGARGYILKSNPVEVIRRMLREALEDVGTEGGGL